MSLRAGCPSCGAEIVFRSALGLYATCESCSTLVVRRDLDVEAIGRVGLVQPDGTLVQRSTRGRYKGKGFEVVGRLQYRVYAPGSSDEDGYAGTWNEWYLLFDDGREGWLGEAHGLFAVNFRAGGLGPFPEFEALGVDQELRLGSDRFWVKDLQRARVVSGEGELPFRIEGGYEANVVDLATGSNAFATIDYSESPPLVFVGEWVRFVDLELTDLRPGAGARETAKPLDRWGCPSCGASLERRSGATLVVACPYCESIIDAADEQHAILARYDGKVGNPPTIPLGARGKLMGEELECLGVLTKSTEVDGSRYLWDEHLLWSPRYGLRWLVEANGHWVLLQPSMARPTLDTLDLLSGGRTYRHFQSSVARVDRALGEFNWRVERGQLSASADYVAPPYQFSTEEIDNEVSWSTGQWLPKEAVEKAFGLSSLPQPSGVAPAQPNPWQKRIAGLRRSALIFALGLCAVQALTTARAASRTAHQEAFTVQSLDTDKERASQSFELGPGTHNVELSFRTNASNNWVYIQGALLSPDHDEVIEFDQGVEFYAGNDGGEAWSEGDPNGQLLLGRVPPGRWSLRLSIESPMPRADVTVVVVEDVPRWAFFWVALAAVVLPWLYVELRRWRFEVVRWRESDHPMVKTGDDS